MGDPFSTIAGVEQEIVLDLGDRLTQDSAQLLLSC